MPLDLTAAGALAGMLSARYAGGSIMLGGIDILASLDAQSVLSFAYTDNTSDQADDLTVEIADPARTWMQTYLPQKGVECTAVIKVFNWISTGDSRELDCGTFWLDQIDFTGPPNTVIAKASSIPTTGIKSQKKYRFWEDKDLQSIAAEIATENGLALVWDTMENQQIKRTDQVETPDLEYLRDLFKDSSLSLKIFNRQLIAYSEEEYEAKGPVYVLTYGLANIISFSFSSKLDDTYVSAKNAYLSPETGKLIETEFVAPTPPEGTEAILMLNERIEVEPDAEGADEEAPELRVDFPALDYTTAIEGLGVGASEASIRKCKAKLREKNKHEKRVSIVVVGNPGYLSGLNMQLTGFGKFDGKWFIESTVHSISEGGYTTEIIARGALDGY